MVDRKRLEANLRLIRFFPESFYFNHTFEGTSLHNGEMITVNRPIPLTPENWNEYKHVFVKQRRKTYDSEFTIKEFVNGEKRWLKSLKIRLTGLFRVLNYQKDESRGYYDKLYDWKERYKKHLDELIEVEPIDAPRQDFKFKLLAVTTLFARGIIGKSEKKTGGDGYYFYNDKKFKNQSELRNYFIDKAFIEKYGKLTSVFNDSLGRTQSKHDLYFNAPQLKKTYNYCEENKLKMTKEFIEVCKKKEIII